MAWEYQDRDMSVLYIFSGKPGIPNPPAFPGRPRHHTCWEERLPPAYCLNFLGPLLYIILGFSLVCFLYTLKLLVFPIC